MLLLSRIKIPQISHSLSSCTCYGEKKRIKLRHPSVMCALRDKPTGPICSACVLLVDDDDNHADADADDEYLPILLVLSKACCWVLYYVL